MEKWGVRIEMQRAELVELKGESNKYILKIKIFIINQGEVNK